MNTDFTLEKVDIEDVDHEEVNNELKNDPHPDWEAYELRLMDLTGCCEAGAPLFVLFNKTKHKARICGGINCEWMNCSQPETCVDHYLRNK